MPSLVIVVLSLDMHKQFGHKEAFYQDIGLYMSYDSPDSELYQKNRKLDDHDRKLQDRNNILPKCDLIIKSNLTVT